MYSLPPRSSLAFKAHLQEIETALQLLLRAHPAGLGEYEIIKSLQQQNCAGFPPVSLLEPLPLFRMHFLLYHVLYRWRDHVWHTQSAHLHISPLCIRLQPYSAGCAAVAEYDPLRQYYLDVTHLYNTDEAEVTQLLGAFWVKFRAGEKRQAALKLLGLQEPADRATIQHRYRILAMQYHPDRGGNADMFCALQAAKEILTKN
jgi:hypothetical protein